jgi:putative chitinase
MNATELSVNEPTRIKIGANQAAKDWINRVYSLYPSTFQNNHVMMWGKGDAQELAMFELAPSFVKRGAVEVKWFQAYPLRQGIGSRAMRELQKLAQEDGIALTLFPWDKGQVSQAKLIKFYKSQGFAPTVKGSRSMYWEPANKQGVAEGLGQDYLSQIPNLFWKPVSRRVWNTIQDEGLDEEQDTSRHSDWVMASLSIDPKDAQSLMAFDSDAIEDFNRFDINLKSRYPGLTDLIDYDRGTVTIVKPANKQGVAEELEEGWKDALGNLAIAGAIGTAGAGGLAASDAYHKWQAGSATPAATAQAPQAKQAQAPVAKSAIARGVQQAQDAKKVEPQPKSQPKVQQVTNITNNPLESVLRNVASHAGLAGIELAAFMAQCAHETLDFKRLTEFGGSLDFRKYDPKYAPKKAKALGNKYVGDGAKYKGRGFIQLTGRHNYKKAGQELGLPLEKHPEMVEDPKIAAQVAVWFWKHRVQPNVDNYGDVKAVTKMINPGMRGLTDRSDNFKSYLGITS